MIDAEDAMPVLLIIGLFILLAVVGQGDYEQEKIEAAHYCEMRAIWEKDSAAGVPEAMRKGWPDYRGEYESVCMDNQRRIEEVAL